MLKFRSIDDQIPILAGAGITLKKELGKLPRINDATDQAYWILLNLGFINSDWMGNSYVASIDGKSAQSMTEEELAAALSGPEDTYVKLEIAEYSQYYSDDKKTCSIEPKVVATGSLRRELSLGPTMIKCDGIDL